MPEPESETVDEFASIISKDTVVQLVAAHFKCTNQNTDKGYSDGGYNECLNKMEEQIKINTDFVGLESTLYDIPADSFNTDFVLAAIVDKELVVIEPNDPRPF